MRLKLKRNFVYYLDNNICYNYSRILRYLSELCKINNGNITRIIIKTNRCKFKYIGDCYESLWGQLYECIQEQERKEEEIKDYKTTKIILKYRRIWGDYNGPVDRIICNFEFKNNENYRDAVYFCLKRTHLERILEQGKVNLDEIKNLEYAH